MNFLRTSLGKSYEYGVEGRFVDDSIEGGFREVHGADIHQEILEGFWFFFILVLHGLDADVGDIDVGYLGVALFEHLLAEPGVARAHVEDAVALVHMGGNDILESAESLVPVEGLGVSRYAAMYLLYLASQYSVLPY